VSRLHVAHGGAALEQLLCMTAWWGGTLPVRLGSAPAEETFWRQTWRPGLASWRCDIAGLVRELDEEHDDEVLLGIPWSHPRAGGVARTSVLWARVEGTQQVTWARKFRPLPTMILQEGSSTRRTLLWALEETVPWATALKQNKRLAYRFGAVQKWADPDVMVFAAPGTCLREGRSRPVPVRVSRLTDATFPLATFAEHRWLKDPPDASAWMGGAR
jgi:hypothetical protein